MAVTYEELHCMTVAQLREFAAKLNDPSVQGYTQMHKEHLLSALCNALQIDMHVHHEVVGVNKKRIKKQIKSLKAKRDQAIAEKDKTSLKEIRRDIHRLKHRLRRATV